MAANKIVRFGPFALGATTTTNLLVPPTLNANTGIAGTNANTYLVIRHMRAVNKTNLAQSLALWLGATAGNAAGTEVIFGGTAAAGALTQGVSVPANSYIDWFGILRMESTTDFLVGGASLAASLTLEGEGEIGVV